jgi:hypothetical protein
MRKFPLFFSSRLLLKGVSFLSVLFLLGIFACSQKKGALALIPQDSDFVVAVNMKSMALKSLSMKQLLSLDFLLKKKNPKESTLMDRLQNAGIDFMGTAYCFGHLPARGPETEEGAHQVGNDEVTYLLPLQDADHFESFLKAEKGRMEGEQEGLKFFAGDSLIVAWNASTAYVTARADQSVEVLKKKLLDVNSLSTKKSLAENNDYFSTLKDKSYDMLFWLDASKVSKNRSAGSGNDALKGNYLGTIVNFEKGKVVFDGNFVSNNNTFGKYADLMDKKVNQDFVNHVPVQSPLSTFALKLNMGTVKKIMQDSNSLTNANQYTQMLGITAEEMIDMLSGDLVVSVINVPEAGNSMPEMYVGLGIANQLTLKKLINNFKNQNFLLDEGQYLSTSFMPDLAMFPQDGKLVMVNSERLRARILSGQGALNKEIASSLKEGAFSGYLDYNVFAAKEVESEPNSEAQVVSRYLRLVTMNAIQTSKSSTDAQVVIFLKDNNSNSLVSLAKMGGELNELRVRTGVEESADTTVVESVEETTAADTEESTESAQVP